VKLWALIAGVLFGLGLGISGMTDPRKVIGFLDVTGSWDPSLAFVMGGALAVHGIGNRLVRKRPKPIFSSAFGLPPFSAIDGRLIGGAVLFGVGWGLAGYCPGPAVVSAASGAPGALVFVGTMAVGMLIYRYIGAPAAIQAASSSS